MSKEILSMLYQKYYAQILRYCSMRLQGDIHAAEDCTQEVFLILQKKLPSLAHVDQIGAWLYQTADNVVKAYRRRTPKPVEQEVLDALPADEAVETVLDVLTDEERELVEQYYAGADKERLAKSCGISLAALYGRMRRIKQKLRQALDDLHK